MNIRRPRAFLLRRKLNSRYTDSMKRLFFILALCIATPVAAQVGPGEQGEITKAPICSKIINRSSVNIQGTIALAPQTLPDGSPQQFSDNFKISPGEFREVCASGPFYEGRRIDLTIRTLIPLFNCKTMLGQEIFLDMEEKDGIKRYSATCR